jgi:toxin ParE1/3/4
VTRLRTARAAREDIREIGRFSKAAYGNRVAREYVDGLSATFALLESRPLVGGIEGDLGQGMRSFGYRSHRIYYRVDGSDLLVVRVLHQARDVAAALSPRP